MATVYFPFRLPNIPFIYSQEFVTSERQDLWWGNGRRETVTAYMYHMMKNKDYAASGSPLSLCLCHIGQGKHPLAGTSRWNKTFHIITHSLPWVIFLFNGYDIFHIINRNILYINAFSRSLVVHVLVIIAIIANIKWKYLERYISISKWRWNTF